ncbi:unnamed protein product [Rotaria socialis]|uniref:Uncharacterized protein n=1 Tax=Rotaria socialis TaxID=392032 RepID=A0A820L3K2_9BILA|nr:unnamed protein product [Rotaria socialis]CAF4349910.1 unnamed protein product [Rotaria socialis]
MITASIVVIVSPLCLVLGTGLNNDIKNLTLVTLATNNRIGFAAANTTIPTTTTALQETTTTITASNGSTTTDKTIPKKPSTTSDTTTPGSTTTTSTDTTADTKKSRPQKDIKACFMSTKLLELLLIVLSDSLLVCS